MDTDKKTEALAFLKDHVTGVLATLADGEQPRARLVYYAADDAFGVYFISLANTRKVADLAAHPKAAFVVVSTEAPRTLQIEGIVSDVTEETPDIQVFKELIKNATSNETYFAPMDRFDPAEFRYFVLKPTWVRWGNFTFGYGSENVFAEIKP
ncbi:MAG: pyridoxamine 5'-phosphate oxidase family protein [Minisyncoccia bacterium]